MCLHPEGTLILQELLALKVSQPCVLVKMSQPCVLVLAVPWQPGVLGLRVLAFCCGPEGLRAVRPGPGGDVAGCPCHEGHTAL